MSFQEQTLPRRKRRNEQELIEELEAKIKEVQTRRERRIRRTESPIAKDFERLKKQMARFVQACMDNQRADIANSALGFMTVLERQSREIRETDLEDESDADGELSTEDRADDLDA